MLPHSHSGVFPLEITLPHQQTPCCRTFQAATTSRCLKVQFLCSAVKSNKKTTTLLVLTLYCR